MIDIKIARERIETSEGLSTNIEEAFGSEAERADEALGLKELTGMTQSVPGAV